MKQPTQQQMEILRAIYRSNGRPDEEWTTGQIGEAIRCGAHHVKNYLPARLRALEKKGYLVHRYQGNRSIWRLGPMVDTLIEAEILT